MCFFFKQKTAYEMRISDWSSDVCSSDLMGEHEGPKKWLVASVRRRAAFRCPAEQGAIRWRLPMPIFLDIVDADAEGLRESRLGEARRNADAHRAGCQLEQRKAPGGVEPVEQRREIAHCAEPSHVRQRIDRFRPCGRVRRLFGAGPEKAGS